jgi:hypothetical protein
VLSSSLAVTQRVAKCILIVDDHAPVRKQVRAYLEKLRGFVCAEAVNGLKVQKAISFEPGFDCFGKPDAAHEHFRVSTSLEAASAVRAAVFVHDTQDVLTSGHCIEGLFSVG